MRRLAALLAVAPALALAGRPKPSRPTGPAACVVIGEVVEGAEHAEVAERARTALGQALSKFRLLVIPAGEPGSSARAFCAERRLKALELSLSVKALPGDTAEAALLVLRSPQRVLVSEFRARGAGGSVVELVGPLTEQLVRDLAKAEAWPPAGPRP